MTTAKRSFIDPKEIPARSIIGPLYQAAFYRTMALELRAGRLPLPAALPGAMSILA